MGQFTVINGKVLKREPQLSKAPSPAEIAAKAYDRAARVAMEWVVEQSGEVDESLQRYMEKHRDAELAELRDEVINPPAIRGKK